MKKMDTKPIKIELEKYLGNWHEIASFPAWFQKGCEDTTATYSKEGNHIKVENSCNINKIKCDKKEKVCKNIKIKKTKIGKAFQTDKNDTLKVQFFFPFKAPYKIEHIDGDYENAIVSSSKNYLWFLSRKKEISPEKFTELTNIVKEKGFDIKKLQKTRQS